MTFGIPAWAVEATELAHSGRFPANIDNVAVDSRPEREFALRDPADRRELGSFQRMQVFNKVTHVALGETPIESRHRAPSLDDGLADLLVGRRRAAR